MRHIIKILFACLALSSSAAKQIVNYDESKIPPYKLEDPLQFADGRKVKNKKDWALRRQEILNIFQREMYGQIPPASKITTEVIEEGITLAGFGTRRQVRMWFRPDKSGPKIDWLVITPRYAKKKVPVIMCLNYSGNQTLLEDKEVLLNDSWLENDKKYIVNHRATESTRGLFAGQNKRRTYPLGMLLAQGYAFVSACYGDISPDPEKPAEQERRAYTGVFDLWGSRDTSRTDNTTALGAWAWALMRGMDMIEQDKRLDARKVILTGCSRLGKAALIAGAFDERFPVVVPVQTGGGGVPLAKRYYGENVKTMTTMFTHWYCKAWNKYADNEQAMPFDQHLLLSCIAPRALPVEGFNEPWFDTKGEFLALKAASPVWKKLGKTGLPDVSWPDNYDTKAIGKYLGYVRRTEQHGFSVYDWMWMTDFADKIFSEMK